MIDDPIPTQVRLVNPQHPEVKAIQAAVDCLQSQGLVAFPTETVYGLGANALSEAAVSRIFVAKGRPSTNPLIVHIASPEQLSEVVVSVPDLALQLASQFWPGPLTLVMPRQACIPTIVSAGLDSVAVRIPSHPVAQALLMAVQLPIAAPSANRSTRPSPTTAAHVLEDLAGRIELVLDGGATPIGMESTVVDLTRSTPVLLRPGGISVEALRTIVPSLEIGTHTPVVESKTPQASPGMMLKHYSPKAKLLLFQGEATIVRSKMQQLTQQLAAQGQHVGILVADQEAPWFTHTPAQVVTLGPGEDLAQIASHLFAAMRDLDSQNVDVMLVRAIAPQGLGLAIYDRLFRAAEGEVIHCE